MILEVTDTTIGVNGLNFVSLTGHGGSSYQRVSICRMRARAASSSPAPAHCEQRRHDHELHAEGIHVDRTNNINLTNMNLTGTEPRT